MVDTSKIGKVRITVLRRFNPSEKPFADLPKLANVTHVNPFLGPCELFKEGQEFVIEGLKMPEGFCGGAWNTIYCNIRTLAFGGNFPWIKEKGVTIMCCYDPLRPVVFKLERI